MTKKVSPERKAQYEQERNDRWRFFGAVGQVRSSLVSVSGMRQSPLFSEETRELARQTENLLWKLVESLNRKKG